MRRRLWVVLMAGAVGVSGCGVRSRVVAGSSKSFRDQLTDLGVRPVGGFSPGCEGLYQPGEELEINGYNFKAGTPVRVFISYRGHGTVEQRVASLAADGAGAISGTIRVPLTASGFVLRKGAGAGLIFFDAIGLGADGVSHAEATQMAGLVSRGKLCTPLPGHAGVEGDPGNRRLQQLAGDPIFHSLASSATTPRLTLSPAMYQQTDFGAGGWSGPSVTLTFSSLKSRRSIYERIAENARGDGWRPVNISRFGSPESWYKTYPNGATATLGIVWLGPANPPPGPVQYQLSGGISLPGENWARFFAHPTPVRNPSPSAQADPGNHRLNQLVGESVFHVLPARVSSHKLTLIPARFVHGGTEAPDVTLDLANSATPRAILRYYEHLAGMDGWQLISGGAHHIADLWHKTYADGAEATLLVTWIPPVRDRSGPNQYAVAGSISLPGQKAWFTSAPPQR
ncbi:MAG: hypothetical protein JO325_15010 [Solirubrobacterales bacterium]|nr:hypothetical protein [Solirubrobacterales bacterium]